MKCDGSLSAHSTVPHTESVTGEWRGDHAKPPKPTSGERLDVCGWRQSRMVSLVFFFVHTGYVRAGRRTTCSRRASNGRYLPCLSIELTHAQMIKIFLKSSQP